MRIMLCQTHIIWEDKEANIAKLVGFMQEAKRQAVDLVCLPEMSFTGFSMHTDLTRDMKPHETVSRIRELAVKYETAVAFGYVTGVVPQDDDRHVGQDSRAYNHYGVVNAHGVLLEDYIKIHPFSYGGEDRYFEGGDRLSHFDFMGFHIGLAICYDLRFPEQFMALGEVCDMILIGANWPAKRAGHWDALLRARAIENQCYVAGVNCYGDIGDNFYSGNSMLVGPDGTVFGEQREEGYAIYELENNVAEVRKTFPVKNDRRNMKDIKLG